jgi:hypothetical protein
VISRETNNRERPVPDYHSMRTPIAESAFSDRS